MKTRLISLLLSLLLIIPMTLSFGVPSAAEAPAVNPFSDLPDGKWYTDAALYCYKYGYMSGTGEGTFAPNGKFTRAMFVTVLYQIDMATDKYRTSSFTDVKAGAWYANAVEWAYSNKYASGLGNGVFGPSNVVTREQLAAFLYTYSKLKGYGVSAQDDLSAFTDAESISGWALNAVKWAVAEKLLSGVGNGLLSPKGQVTRAQIAVILKNYLKDHGVQWDGGTVQTERTCTVDGVTVFTSLDGEHTKTVTYKAWHKFDEGKVTKKADCVNEGTKKFTCTVCKATKTEPVKRLSSNGKHTWDGGKVTTSATCQKEGVTTYTCKVCKGTYTKPIAKTDHKWNSGVVTTEPTCQRTGVKTFTCTHCGKTNTSTLSKVGHKYVDHICKWCDKVEPGWVGIYGTWYLVGSCNTETGKTTSGFTSTNYLHFYKDGSVNLVAGSSSLDCTYRYASTLSDGSRVYYIYFVNVLFATAILDYEDNQVLFNFVKNGKIEQPIYIYGRA